MLNGGLPLKTCLSKIIGLRLSTFPAMLCHTSSHCMQGLNACMHKLGGCCRKPTALPPNSIGSDVMRQQCLCSILIFSGAAVLWQFPPQDIPIVCLCGISLPKCLCRNLRNNLCCLFPAVRMHPHTGHRLSTIRAISGRGACGRKTQSQYRVFAPLQANKAGGRAEW